MAISTTELNDYLTKLFTPFEFKDYGPNGLQIEGTTEIKSIAFAVSATKKSIEEAISKNADCMIVHHGLFWGFHGARTLTGPFAKRVLPLCRSNINLFGYHLPLDAHLEVGNAASIARKIGLTNLEAFGDYKGSPTGVKGSFDKVITSNVLQKKLEEILEHHVIHAYPEDDRGIKTMGIITGGANSEWKEAAAQGLDSYLTGEISEHDWHEASEAGIHFFAGGHNATEQFGVQSLMEKIKADFSALNLDLFFIDSENPA